LTKKKRKRISDIPPYIVPLSEQAREIVRHLLDNFKPAQVYLLPGERNIKQRISENTLNKALHRMGYADQLTGHGIRATISTALNELGYPKIWVDAQLSHADPDRTSATYNHAEYVEQRRVMMQDWADRLDLFEQGQVAAASTALTITLQGLPTIAGQTQQPPPVLHPNAWLLPARTRPRCRPRCSDCRRSVCRPACPKSSANAWIYWTCLKLRTICRWRTTRDWWANRAAQSVMTFRRASCCRCTWQSRPARAGLAA